MDFHGNINLRQNQMQRMVVQSEDNFPVTPIIGRVVFKGAKLYMCVAINNLIPVWLPLTNKIDTYVHTEGSVATTWTITHNLNTTIPLLQIYNAAGEMLIPDSVTPTSNNIMEVTFNTAVDGTAIVLFGDLMPQSGIGLLEPDTMWTIGDISNTSYDSVSLDVSGQGGSNPRAITISPDGTKMYLIVDGAFNEVVEYDLGTPNDLSTAVFNSSSFSVVNEDSTPYAIGFKPDGTKMFVSGFQNNRIKQYTLSPAWDVSSAVYDSVDYYGGVTTTQIVDFLFSDDGTKFYSLSPGNDALYESSLSVAWDITTISYTGQFDITVDAQAAGFFFNEDKTKLYHGGFINGLIYQYTLGTAGDVTTMVYDNISLPILPVGAYIRGLTISADGTKMYMSDDLGDSIHQYSTNI